MVLPEPVPPLIRNASLASIIRARSFAAPGVTGPEATQSSTEKLRPAGTRSEMQVPRDARLPSTAWTRLPSASLPLANVHRVVQTCNLTYCRGDFRHASQTSQVRSRGDPPGQRQLI